LDSKKCIALIQSATDYTKKNPEDENFILEKIGFSGGELFLALDTVNDIISFSYEKGLMFDFLMTNGDWWKTEDDLYEKLSLVAQKNFDGKIGLSFDVFHNQKPERIEKFLFACYEIFKDNSCVEIFSVIPHDKSLFIQDEKLIQDIQKIRKNLNKRFGSVFLNVRRIKQSIISENLTWKDKHWFKEDYCQSTGNVFYVHTDGNIAPCCGFANENRQLYIGTLNDTWEQLIKNAQNNNFVDICFSKGLLKYKDELIKKGVSVPGTTDDMCAFCDWCMKTVL
jgi:hypothetical protein